MKIVLIGPVYPYKGGIAHYTSLLCRELQKSHNVEMVSFSLQYPKVLFKREQKDYTNKSFAIEGTHYWINTINPFTWIKVTRQIKKCNADAIIMEWWHPYFAPCYFVLTKLLKKCRKLFICHNVFPHERFPMDRWLTKVTLKQGDKFVVQSRTDADDLIQIIPRADYIVTPHPTYNAFRMKGISREEARKLIDLDLETPMLLFFGFVREYKGLRYLLKALPIAKEAFPMIKLWIVGDFGTDRDEYIKIIEENEIDESIVIIDGYVPDQEVEQYFAATDLVVLPYTSATQSGIAQIAYGFEKPVIATNVGGLPDVIEDGKTGYIVEKENELELAEAINKFFLMGKAKEFAENIKDREKEFSWETLVNRIDKLLNA